MILSDVDIARRLEQGDLVIDPLDNPELQIQPASVDLRLGREFLEFQRTNIPCIHPDSEREVSEYVSETRVEEDGKFILHPSDFVLGTTIERVEIPPDLIAHVEGRSSLGRLAVVVHASLPYDEEVFLWTPENGFGFYEIGEVVESERSARAVAFDPRTLRVDTYRVTDYITNPRKRIYRVTLESGRQVHVTKDHNLFTLNEYGQVVRIPSEDAEGELVMIPRSLPASPTEEETIDLLNHLDPSETTIYATDGFADADWDRVPRGSHRFYIGQNSAPMNAIDAASTPSDVEVAFKQSTTRVPRHISITEEFAWVLGFYIAEGSARRKQIQVSNRDTSFLDRFAEFFEEYGVGTSWYETDRLTKLTICSALWSKVFRGVAGAGPEKSIPERAWDWPNSVLKALLEGLIDGDGHRRKERDTFYTANSKLANEVSYLATRVGLQSSIRGREREMYIPMSDVHHRGEEWSVDISGERHKKGQHVPLPSGLLKDLRNDAGLTMREAATEMGYSSKSSISNVENECYRSIKRSSLRRFANAYARAGATTTRVEQILNGDVRFDPVVSVEKTDRYETTYDLEVQPGGRPIENFVGGQGGIFLSNTAGLCDPGYRGQITLELSNLGSAPVALSPGMRVSQLTFTELTTPAERPYGSARGSKYQDQVGPQASRIRGDQEFGGEQM